MGRRPKYAMYVSSDSFEVLECEARQIATAVASYHAGRFRKDKNKNEHMGMNLKTFAKYLHVVRVWYAFCARHGRLLHAAVGVRQPAAA